MSFAPDVWLTHKRAAAVYMRHLCADTQSEKSQLIFAVSAFISAIYLLRRCLLGVIGWLGLGICFRAVQSDALHEQRRVWFAHLQNNPAHDVAIQSTKRYAASLHIIRTVEVENKRHT